MSKPSSDSTQLDLLRLRFTGHVVWPPRKRIINTSSTQTCHLTDQCQMLTVNMFDDPLTPCFVHW